MLPVKRTTAGTELGFADSDYAKKQCTDFSSAAGSGAGTSAAASSPVDMAGGRSLNGTNVKNLVLAGVKSVTPHDVGTVELWDLSSSFVFSEEDLGKNRALASVQKLQEVNNAEIIGTLTSELTKEHLSNFQAVVFTDVSLEKPPEGGKMGETPRKIDMEELMSYSDNLTEVLREEKDVVGLKQFLRQSESLQSQCEKDLNEVQKSIKDYEQKIHECKQKAAAAISQSASDAELDSLQKELDDEQKLENTLREDLRVIITEIDDLEQQRVSGEKEMQTIKKNEQDELRTQMKLSMYASVTNIIPYLEDMSKVSGHIVARDKKVVDKFEFDPSEDTAFDTCNNLWKMINL